MNFPFSHSHRDTPNPLLYGGARWVFDAAQSGGRTTAQNPREGREPLNEKKLNEQRNQRFLRQLDNLVARNAIDAETAEEARNALASTNADRQVLARRLALNEIDQDTFEQANDLLESDNSMKRGLARLFSREQINNQTFDECAMDLDDGDGYQAPLARRLITGIIDQEEYHAAHQYLDNNDPAFADERTASEQLALGHIQPDAFRARMFALGRITENRTETRVEEEDIIAVVQKEIKNRMASVMLQVEVILEELPASERTQPLQKLRSTLNTINRNDSQNHAGLTAALRQVNENDGVSMADVRAILEADFETRGEVNAYRATLTGMANMPAAMVGTIIAHKLREWELEQEFIDTMKKHGDIMRVAENDVKYRASEKRLIELASRTTGITLAAGTPIEYIYPDDVTGNVRTVTITNVAVEPAPVHDHQGRVIGREVGSMTITLSDGQAMPYGRFMKWVNAMDAHEVLAGKTEAEQKLGLNTLGLQLKAGQGVEFTNGYTRERDGSMVPQRESVRIRAVTDETVQWENEVTTLTPEEDPHAMLTTPRQTAEMSMGEMTKWMRRHDAMPEIRSLAELREILKNHQNHKNQKLNPYREAALYPAITAAPGELLSLGDAQSDLYQVQESDDTQITFKGGQTMTLPTFYLWVRDNNVERANAEDLAERSRKNAERLASPEDEAGVKKKGFVEKMKDKLAMVSFDAESPFKIGKHKPLDMVEEVWNKYQFMSMMDLINLGKEIIEFVKRKHTRKSKMRYSTVGIKLPGQLGTEFERVSQSAETEEMKQYKEAMNNWGVFQIMDKLHATSSKDEAKACFIVLTEKGELRWDDMGLWNTMNRLSAKFLPEANQLYIPLTRKPQPHPETGIPTSGEDRIKDPIDKMWGDGQWAEWFSKNVSSYNNNKNAYAFKAKQLEADPKGTGGLAGELERLLKEWKAGKYVNPHEYEQLIDFAIDAGKMRMEEKLFYLFEGVTAKAPQGGPYAGMALLHVDRIGELDGKHLNKFPILDYFTNKNEKPFDPRYISGDIELDDTKHGYRIDDFAAIRDAHFKGDSDKSKYGHEMSRFLWENMLMDPQFRTRLSKGIRMAQNMDHDDAHVFIPICAMEDINTITGVHNGQIKYFSNDGYKNGYVGFNQYLVSLSNRHEELIEQIKTNPRVTKEQVDDTVNATVGALQSYFLYDSYLDGRREAHNSARAHMDAARYDEFAVNDGTMTVRQHQQQLTGMLKEICDAYNIDWKEQELFDVRAKFGDKRKEEMLIRNMETFLKEELPKKLKEDPSKMLEIIGRRKNSAAAAAKSGGSHGGADGLGGIKVSNRLIEVEAPTKKH